MSDLHLGGPTALLTDSHAATTPGKASGNGSQVRDAFSAALVATLEAFHKDAPPGEMPPAQAPPADLPEVVLLGDIFDLSLGTPRGSIDNFDGFLKSLAQCDGRKWLGRFLFVPGNHDHELWTISRYEHMVGTTRSQDRFIHTTPAFADPETQPKAALIDRILRENGFRGRPAKKAATGGQVPGARFQASATFYPNLGFASQDGSRVVVLHHGHFIEPIYRAMSTLGALLDGKPDVPRDAEALERANASWIDFIWSTDGDNGRLGAEIGALHDALLTGREDMTVDRRLARILAAKLTDSLPLPHTAATREWTAITSKAAVDSVLGSYSQMERFSYLRTLGADALAGLKAYLAGVVLRQIKLETKVTDTGDVTFIFGHTHKPFESRIPVPGYRMPPAVYNTGGWDMDTPMFGTKLGAAAVFVDDALNVASLRLCGVPPEGGDGPVPEVRVATADGSRAGNPLAERLHKAVTGETPRALWAAFAAEAAAAYRSRRLYILHGPRLGGDGQGDRKTGGMA